MVLLNKTLALQANTRNKLSTNAIYKFNSALKSVGCDRNAYHKNSIDGNKGRKLMEKHEDVGMLLFESLTESLSTSKQDRKDILEKNNIAAVDLELATQDELENEISFFVQTLHLLNCILPTIRVVRDTIMSDNEIKKLEENIRVLKKHWCQKRNWEKTQISVTPKWHLLFYHVVPRLKKFRCVCHFSEDPIERTHAYDAYLGRVFSAIRNPVQLEDSKKKVVQLTRHQQVTAKKSKITNQMKRKFKPQTILKRNVKRVYNAAIKSENRNVLKEEMHF